MCKILLSHLVHTGPCAQRSVCCGSRCAQRARGAAGRSGPYRAGPWRGTRAERPLALVVPWQKATTVAGSRRLIFTLPYHQTMASDLAVRRAP